MQNKKSSKCYVATNVTEAYSDIKVKRIDYDVLEAPYRWFGYETKKEQ